MDSWPRVRAAVMFTDVVGFSSMMEKNESRALETLSIIREQAFPLIEESRGELIKEMGDGTLSTFPEPSKAVGCARELQRRLRGNDFSVRIGLHWGQMVKHQHDILGDAVNVAARIQQLAPPGGVCVSQELLHNYGPGRRPETVPMGLRKLKGIGRLVELFALRGTERFPLPVNAGAGFEIDSPPRENEPKIAVIPLLNMGAEEDGFIAHSISADLVSDITGAGHIRVTPLSDVLRIQKAVSSPDQVAQRLNVQFLVKGTLWRQDEQFQLSIELHDLLNETLAWSDSWTEDLFQLPTIKGKLADGLLKVLGIGSVTMEGVTESETSRTEAYEDYLKAREIYRNRKTATETAEARALLMKALDSDPTMIPAQGLLGVLQCENGEFRRAHDTLTAVCRLAVERGDRPGHVHALNWIGKNFWRQNDYASARETFQRTLRLARSMNDTTGIARALSNIGLMDSNLGKYSRGLDYLNKALKTMGPEEVSSLLANTLCNIGLTHWYMGDNSLALEYYRRAMELYEKLEDQGGKAYILRNIGIIKRSTGSCEEAIQLTGKALGIYEDLDDDRGRCHALISLGNINMQLCMLHRAREDYQQALNIAESNEDRFTQGILMTNLGTLALTTMNYERALKLHREALGISLSLNDSEGVAENLWLIGRSLFHMGNFHEAIAKYEESISLMEEMGASARTCMARMGLALALLAEDGSEMNLLRAAEQAETVEGLLNPSTTERTVILWRLSQVYRQLADSGEEVQRRNLKIRSVEYLHKAYHSLMKTAGSLEKGLRERYLKENTDYHDIVEAFGELNSNSLS